MNNYTEEDEGFKQLWRHVIRQAILDYQKDPEVNSNPHVRSRLIARKRSAKQWLFESTKDQIGSLRWTCNVIDVKINYVRSLAVI